MILSGQTIRKLCQKARSEALITPFKERDRFKNGMSLGLGPAGYDITIDQTVHIKPGGFALASTVEKFNIPTSLVMRVCDKSTWARMGLAVQNTVAEPGWRGHLTLELTNHSQSSIQIERDTPVAQVIFELLDQPTELPYDGKYQDQARCPVLAILG